MPVEYSLRTNTYYDSVFLMGLAGKIGGQPGVTRTAALMASPNNKPLLVEFGVPAAALEPAGSSDLVLAVEAQTRGEAAAALALVDQLLRQDASEFDELRVASLGGALQRLPEANLAAISVPGEHAAYEARRALERGVNVFIFSDNVSLDDELALKQAATAKGLIVMGPDCGTALIGGVGVGFANVVRRGRIGIVGPSGTGIQQVSSLIDNAGGGVSHAIGSGGRDLSDAVGGITTLQALEALAEDAETDLIVVVSKPPGPDTRRRVLDWIAAAKRPVVTCFLGPEPTPQAGPQHTPVRTLDEAASVALALVNPYPPSPSPETGEGAIRGAGFGPSRASRSVVAALAVAGTGAIQGQAERTASSDPARGLAPLPVSGRGRGWGNRLPPYIRGLFAGGTFCYEAQQIFLDAGIEVRSNAPLLEHLGLADARRSEGHSMVDLGDDEFTRGRPHPMIDAGLRNERILAEARDPEVGAILLDFILGYGAAPDPVADTAGAIREAQRLAAAAGRELTFIASVCGTDADPQQRSRQIVLLQQLGVRVLPSSSAAARGAVAAILASSGEANTHA